MKFCIRNEDGICLYWGSQILVFDTYDDALVFLRSVERHGYINPFRDCYFIEKISNFANHINATGKVMSEDGSLIIAH